jgi:hypothetical protein
MEARTRPKGRDRANQGEGGGKEKTKSRVAREQTTQENTNIPGNKREQGDSASPMEG